MKCKWICNFVKALLDFAFTYLLGKKQSSPKEKIAGIVIKHSKRVRKLKVKEDEIEIIEELETLEFNAKRVIYFRER